MKPHARVRRRVLLPGTPICCRMQQAVACHIVETLVPLRSVICSQHSSVSLSSRSLSSIEQAQSPSPIYFQNVLPWKRRDTRFCLCGARSSSALNMLVTPYNRELRDFNAPSGDPRSALTTLQKRTTSGH